jgi:hypothetical protein
MLLALAGDLSAAAAHQPVGCAFNDRLAHEIISHRDCGWFDASGQPHLRAKYWKRLVFERGGLASVSFGGWFYLFDRKGRSAPVMTLDNWAEGFSDGLARSERGGKIGYIDRTLRLVIPARYDGALPFSHGVAAVCRGCTVDRSDEHWSYEGGQWFCIDRGGRESRRKGNNC